MRKLSIALITVFAICLATPTVASAGSIMFNPLAMLMDLISDDGDDNERDRLIRSLLDSQTTQAAYESHQTYRGEIKAPKRPKNRGSGALQFKNLSGPSADNIPAGTR